MRHAWAYDLPSVPALIAFLQAATGYPTKPTWLNAVKQGAYHSWPGLTSQLAARYCPDTDETHFGHMAQPWQHIRSTKTNEIPTTTPTTTPTAPTANAIELHELPINRLFTDDTGQFHPRSRSSNQYIMVALHALSNAILVQPFASKQDRHCILACNAIFTWLQATNNAPALHIMENEASNALKLAITSNNCQLQLVPPHVYRRNAAE